jgi:hypothetical protein
MRSNRAGTVASIGRGVIAGIAGTGVMTVFQKCVEMPITRREDSYAPAMFAETVLPVQPTSEQQRYRLNYAAHFGLGMMWGAAYGIAARAGLRGNTAVIAVFATVLPADILLNTALGLYQPRSWSGQDWVVDILDKFVQARAAGAIFDRYLDPAHSS